MPGYGFSIEVDTRDLGYLIKRLGKSKAVMTRAMEEEGRLLGRTVVDVMRSELEAVKYTGALERSVSTRIEPSTSSGVVKVSVYPTAKHAPYIRYGTGPYAGHDQYWPPIAPLKRWAAWKLGDENAAYAIRQKIHERGTSRYAEMLYGEGGANPFDERTMNRTETKIAVERFEAGVWRRFVSDVMAKG